MSEQDLVPITEDDLAGFTQKLTDWGESLEAKDRALLNILVDKARDTEPEMSDEQLETVAGGVMNFRSSLTNIFPRSLFSGGLKVSGWVEAGDPWIRGI